MMALYRSPEYHSTQGEYDLIRETFQKLFWNQAIGLGDVV